MRKSSTTSDKEEHLMVARDEGSDASASGQQKPNLMPKV